MTGDVAVHQPYLELAAMGIDFPLAAAEQRALDQHLAACLSCRRIAASLRADARAVAALPEWPMRSLTIFGVIPLSSDSVA